jgi:uncharacterized protein (TIGR02231 family)
VVNLHARAAARATLTLSYVTPEAGWAPAYDLHASKIGDPVQLVYKARVFQISGIDWNATRLTLSSGNPSRGAQAPAFMPRYLRLLDDNTGPVPRMAAKPLPAPAPAMTMESAGAGNSVRQQQPLDGYVATDASGIDVQFQISLPYSIPSDGKGHMVMVKSAQLKAAYRHLAMPRLDTDVFLQAQVSGWGDLNLLPGVSNIFYEGNYVGAGRIDPARAKDTLDISLGRDKQILVKRDSDPAFKQGPQFFGNDARQQFGASITARNTRKEPVDLVVIDQVPISRDSTVRVEDLRHPEASLDAATGELKWTFTLAPGQARTLPFSYTVRYPKDRTVLGL